MEENKRLSTRSGYYQRCACVVCMTSAISWPNCIFAVARIVDCVSYLVEDFDVGMLAEPDDLVGYTPQLETT